MKKLLLAAATLATLAAPVKADPLFVGGHVLVCGVNTCDTLTLDQYRARREQHLKLVERIGQRDFLKGQEAQAVGDNAAACAAYYNATMLLAGTPAAAKAFPQEAKDALKAGGLTTCADDVMKVGVIRALTF